MKAMRLTSPATSGNFRQEVRCGRVVQGYAAVAIRDGSVTTTKTATGPISGIILICCKSLRLSRLGWWREAELNRRHADFQAENGIPANRRIP